MRAVQVVELTGPAGVEVREVPEPVAGPDEVLVEARSIGVSFPDLLMCKGLYQQRPEVPFTLGIDVAGVVRAAPPDSGFTPGQRVTAIAFPGAAAEVVAVQVDRVLPLPDGVPFEVGAALGMNYLTAQFVLRERADLRPGETVLVHGGAGGVGTACVQVARAYGARPIAVVSSLEKAHFAREAGADEAVLTGGFRSAVDLVTGNRGVDVVVDVVGGEVFLDSLRCLAPQGRLMVVGFASEQGIPEVRVNRLLLNNIDVRGAAWAEYALGRPGYLHAQWDELMPMVASGVISPPIGARYAMDDVARALRDLDERRVLGKAVVNLDPAPDSR